MTKRLVEVVCGCVREGVGGGGLPPPSDNGPDTWGMRGLALRGQPLKRPCLFK